MTLSQSIRQAIDHDETGEIARELVRFPSFTREETPLAEWLHGFFVSRGLESQLQEIEPGRLQTLAWVRGSGGGKTLMLNSHLDIDPLPTDFPGDPWAVRVEGDRLYGGGIQNMKAGLAAMIEAGLAASRVSDRLAGDVLLACVASELEGGYGTVRMLELGVTADMAICPEPLLNTSQIITKQGGVMQVAIHVRGKTVHVLQAEHGVNAAQMAALVVRALDGFVLSGDPDPDLPALPRVSVGSVIAGRGDEWEMRGAYLTPDRAMVVVDVRYTQAMTADEVVGEIGARLDALACEHPQLSYDFEFPMRPERGALRQVIPPVSVPTTAPVVQALSRCVETVTGNRPSVGVVLPMSYGGSDITHLHAHGVDAVWYGPGGGFSDHGVEPWASLEHIRTCTEVYGEMIAAVCGDPSQASGQTEQQEAAR